MTLNSIENVQLIRVCQHHTSKFDDESAENTMAPIRRRCEDGCVQTAKAGIPYRSRRHAIIPGSIEEAMVHKAAAVHYSQHRKNALTPGSKAEVDLLLFQSLKLNHDNENDLVDMDVYTAEA
eukprot:Colp12_sorted_trinity150504_noHs@3768